MWNAKTFRKLLKTCWVFSFFRSWQYLWWPEVKESATLFITLEEEVFQQRDGRDVPEVKSWKNFHTIVFVKAELFSHFHHSCRHPLCSCLFSSKLKLRPTLNLKELPTLFTKSSLPLCSENTGIGNFIQSWKVVKHGKNTKYWVVVSSLECISPLLFLHCNV